MRIYDPCQETLEALRRSNIELVIGVPNENIKSIANSVSSATQWVQNNILSYSEDIKFRYIVVGNEIDPNNDLTSLFVLNAMQNINKALASANLQNQIKVSTAIHMGLLGSSYPPSAGAFSQSSVSYITPIVKFLLDNDAPILANVYTYFSYKNDPNDIDLSFALFTSPNVKVRDGNYEYQNLFDATLGALYAALEKVGGANLEVVISESGWPSHGDVAASVENAQIYYENLIKHVSSGTLSRPNQALETYLFAMFDENQKGPAETERHYGLFTPNKQLKYQIINQLLGSSSSTTPQPEPREGGISFNSTTPTSEEGGISYYTSSSSPKSEKGLILSLCFSLLFLYFI